MTKDVGKTTYLLEMDNGELKKITVPSNWRVSFGPITPGSQGQYGGKLCLRFYESEKQQRALFTEVKSFRDVSIAIEERKTTTKQEHYRKHDEAGGEDKIVIVEAQAHEWVNPDEPVQGRSTGSTGQQLITLARS